MLALQGVVMAAVVVVFLNLGTDFKAEIGRDGHIAGVEQAMDIPAQQ